MKTPFCFAGIAAILLCGTGVHADEPLARGYATLEVGPAFVPDIDLRLSGGGAAASPQYHTGVRGNLALGYQFNPSWAIELQSGVIWNSTESGSLDFWQVPVLLNAVYRVPLNNSWTPYLHAGAGVAVTTMEALVIDGGPIVTVRRVSMTDVSFACQAGAGIKYQLSPHADVGLGYEFLATLDHSWDAGNGITLTADAVYTHSVLASFTWRF